MWRSRRRSIVREIEKRRHRTNAAGCAAGTETSDHHDHSQPCRNGRGGGAPAEESPADHCAPGASQLVA